MTTVKWPSLGIIYLSVKQKIVPRLICCPWLDPSMKYYEINTAWKASEYGVIPGPYFPVFGLNTVKYGPEITPYLDTFHTVADKFTPSITYKRIFSNQKSSIWY